MLVAYKKRMKNQMFLSYLKLKFNYYLCQLIDNYFYLALSTIIVNNNLNIYINTYNKYICFV